MAVLYKHSIAVFDDSHQPTGTVHWRNDGPFGISIPHPEWKKLRHELVLTIEGPDDVRDAVVDCLQKGAVAAAITILAAAFVGAGLGATGPAFEAFRAAFAACVGKAVDIRIDDHSDWIFWDM